MHEESYNNSNLGLGRLSFIIVTVVAIIIAFVFISFAGTCVTTYNNLVDMQEEVELAEANVETMMQRRLELIPDLVSTVKAYTEYEEQVFTDIAEAREALGNSFSTGDPDAISEANENLSIAVNSLLAIAEDYPKLTAGEQYTSLMDQLERSVNRITIARETYNEQVAIYNKAVRRFPGNILASIFEFEEMKEFTADKAANNSSMVDFGD